MKSKRNSCQNVDFIQIFVRINPHAPNLIALGRSVPNKLSLRLYRACTILYHNQLRFVYTYDDNFKISIDIDNLCTQGGLCTLWKPNMWKHQLDKQRWMCVCVGSIPLFWFTKSKRKLAFMFDIWQNIYAISFSHVFQKSIRKISYNSHVK